MHIYFNCCCSISVDSTDWKGEQKLSWEVLGEACCKWENLDPFSLCSYMSVKSRSVWPAKHQGETLGEGTSAQHRCSLSKAKYCGENGLTYSKNYCARKVLVICFLFPSGIYEDQGFIKFGNFWDYTVKEAICTLLLNKNWLFRIMLIHLYQGKNMWNAWHNFELEQNLSWQNILLE